MSGQYINHFNAIRNRVTGSGNLRQTLSSLDAVYTVSLTNLVMSTTTNKFPTVNVNFSQPKAQLIGTTTEIDEIFLIKEIMIYVKPIFTSYPQ